MRAISDCLSIVMMMMMMMMMMMLCLEMAVGREQKNRPLLSYEKDFSAASTLENDHAEPLLPKSENHHDDITTTNNSNINNNNNNDDDDNEEKEKEEEKGGGGGEEEETSRRLEDIDFMSFYFSADFEVRFYRRRGPRCFERHHDTIVSILMDGLDEVVGRSEFAGLASMVNPDAPICSEDDGTRRRHRLLLRGSGSDSSSSAATTATTTRTEHDDKEEENEEDEAEDARNLQLRATYFLHNFHSGAYKCRLCKEDNMDPVMPGERTAAPTATPLSMEQKLDALSVDASAHITSALQLSPIRCLSRDRSSARVKLSMVNQTNVGGNGCEQQ